MSIKMHNNEKKRYLVLGAPHSATSFISRCLHRCGVNMGKKFSKRFFEDREFVKLNEKIFKMTNSSWNNPPSKEDVNNVDVSKEIEVLFKDREDNQFWGFKDPRTALTFDKYYPYLDGDTYLICVFRKPEKVLESITHKKKNIDEEAIKIYNKRIIDAIRKFCNV